MAGSPVRGGLQQPRRTHVLWLTVAERAAVDFHRGGKKNPHKALPQSAPHFSTLISDLFVLPPPRCRSWLAHFLLPSPWPLINTHARSSLCLCEDFRSFSITCCTALPKPWTSTYLLKSNLASKVETWLKRNPSWQRYAGQWFLAPQKLSSLSGLKTYIFTTYSPEDIHSHARTHRRFSSSSSSFLFH